MGMYKKIQEYKLKYIFIMLTIFACNSNITYPWYKGSLEELMSITGSKLIMIDFYTDT